jgi:tetratricopeptide (TPR) repeat protein
MFSSLLPPPLPSAAAHHCSPKRLRGPIAALFGLALALAAPAPAATPGASLKKFEEGVREFTAGHPGEALQAFQVSMELEPSPNTLFKIAKCYLALNRTASAYTSFRRAALLAADRIKATGEQRFAPTQAAADAEAAQLASLVPHLILTLPADLPPRVTLALDGEPLPAALWQSAIEIDPGPHRLAATGSAINPYETSFELQPREDKRLELAIVRRQTGTIRLALAKRPVGLAVAIDAEPISPEQLTSPIILGIGLHKLEISAPGYLDFFTEQTLHDKEALTLAVSLSLAPRPKGAVPRVAPIVAGAITLAVLGFGIGFGATAQAAENEQLVLDPLFRDPTVRDGIRTNATIANALFGISGALGLATVGLAIATRPPRPPPPKPRRAGGRLALVPTAEPGAAAPVAAPAQGGH